MGQMDRGRWVPAGAVHCRASAASTLPRDGGDGRRGGLRRELSLDALCVAYTIGDQVATATVLATLVPAPGGGDRTLVAELAELWFGLRDTGASAAACFRHAVSGSIPTLCEPMYGAMMEVAGLLEARERDGGGHRADPA